MITEKQIDVLASQSKHTLAEWWNELNRWSWVDALGPAEPIPNPWRPETQRHEIMMWIETKIGMEYILRVCNVDIDKRMSDDEFSRWWNSRGTNQ